MKDNGYIYAELLASLIIICFLFSTCIPMYTQIQRDRKDASIQTTARHILEEKLLIPEESGIDQLQSGSIFKDGLEFTFTWSENEEYPLYKEGCVSYQTLKKKKVEICDLAAK